MKSYSAGFFHWSSQRSSALVLISLIFFILSANFFSPQALYLSHFILVIIVFHFKLGLETLIEDYIHDFTLKTFAKILLRLIGIYVLKSIFLIAIMI